MQQLIERFAPVIKSLTRDELKGAPSLNEKLRLVHEGTLEVCYVPFDYVNKDARIVIAGITPGRTQLINAICEARRQLDAGAELDQVLRAAKQTGAFSGTMRPNLVALLDFIGIQRWLGITSCDELFGSAAHLVQTTSVLCHSVFVNGENYNGTPNMIRSPLLRNQLISYFGEQLRALPNAVYVPLGDKVAEALYFLANEGMLGRSRILDGLPHPSGANAERIAYFLGRKDRKALSAKTNPEKLEKVRDQLMHRVVSL